MNKNVKNLTWKEFCKKYEVPIDEVKANIVPQLMKAQLALRERSFQDLEFFIQSFFPEYTYCLKGDPWEFHKDLPQMAFGHRNTLTTRQRMELILEILSAKKSFSKYLEYEPGAEHFMYESLESLRRDLSNPKITAVFGVMAPKILCVRKGQRMLVAQNGVKLILRQKAQEA